MRDHEGTAVAGQAAAPAHIVGRHETRADRRAWGLSSKTLWGLAVVAGLSLAACSGGAGEETGKEDPVIPAERKSPSLGVRLPVLSCPDGGPSLMLRSGPSPEEPVSGDVSLDWDVEPAAWVLRFECQGVPGSVTGGLATCEVDTRAFDDGIGLIEAVAWDACGREARAQASILVDNTPPLVTLVLDPHDQVLRPSSEPVRGLAVAVDEDVRSFFVEVEGESVGTLAGPGTLTFESESFRGGTSPRELVVRAVAEDHAGNRGIAEARISVDRLIWQLKLDLRQGRLARRPMWLDGNMLFLWEQALLVSPEGELVAAIDAPEPQRFGIADPVEFPDGTLRVVTVTGVDSSTPKLLALDRDLQLLWDAPVRNPWARAAPGLNGETLVNEEDGSIVVFEADGSLRWRRHVAVQDFCCAANSVTPGVLPDGSIVTTWGGGLVHAVDAGGGLKWTLDLRSGTGHADFNPIESGVMLVPSTRALSIHGEDVGYLTAINFDGSIQWQQREIGTDFVPEVFFSEGRDIVHVPAWDPPGVLAFDLDGRKLWHWETGQEDRPMIAVAPDGMVYATSLDYTLVAVDPNEGVVWRYDWRDKEWPDQRLTGFAGAPPLIGPDGTVYVATWYGRIFALEP